MQSQASTIDEYIDTLPDDRKVAIIKLREIINQNIPNGFEEVISYGMIGWVVPHSIYPKGYHCNTKLPLPFLNIASQKNFIAVYHMGIYSDEKLLEWFKNEYVKFTEVKLDMGKSCIRFKKMDSIPYNLIAELVKKMTPENWISIYETMLNSSKSKQS